MKTITGLLVAWLAFAGSVRSDTTPAKTAIHGDEISCGIADIDLIRAEVPIKPTEATNVQSRRAALYRWWRLLWHTS